MARPSAVVLLLVFVWFAGPVLAQSELVPLEEPSQVPLFVTSSVTYWGPPVLALILSLTFGLWRHTVLVRQSSDAWPRGERNFRALCMQPLLIVLVAFGMVAALFAWIAFSGPATADEWLIHQKTASATLGACLLAAVLPWTRATKAWR